MVDVAVHDLARLIEQKGNPVTVRIYEEDGEDDYGPTYTRTDHTITMVLAFTRRAVRHDSAAAGIQFLIDAEAYMLNTDFDPLGIPSPLPADIKRPEIIIGDAKYEAIDVDRSIVGLTRFVCQKMRS